MADKLLTKSDLADRWQVEERTIDNWRKAGIIQSVKGIPAIRFTEQHVLELEGIKLDRMSPLERKRLEVENEKLKQEKEKLTLQNEKLSGIISNVLAETSQIIKLKKEAS